MKKRRTKIFLISFLISSLAFPASVYSKAFSFTEPSHLQIMLEDKILHEIYNLSRGQVYAAGTTKNATWTDWQHPFGMDVHFLNISVLFIAILFLLALVSLSACRCFPGKVRALLNLAVTTVQASRELLKSSSLIPAAINERVNKFVEDFRRGAIANNPPDVNPSAFVGEDFPYAVEDVKDATVLIVEDNQELLNYLKYEFSFDMKRVLVAGNGAEAVKVLGENKVDLIVSDVMMPEMDGFALCLYVKTTLAISHIPVILLTARSDESKRMLGYKNGADDYITKPFELVTIRESIDRLLKHRARARENFRTAKGRPEVLESTFSSADEHFLIRFDKLIRDNISDTGLDVPFVVDYFGIAGNVLFVKVKQLTGMNIQGCIDKIRMEKVMELMSTTSLTLAEIGEKAGFSSPRCFSTSFKAYTGKTPSQYKKDIEQGKV